MASIARSDPPTVAHDGALAHVLAGIERALQTSRGACALLTLLSLALFLPGFFTLQPMDRDEPRFAQASKQMVETGDLVDIRFQGEARHKKPVGIYWMQAGVVAAAEKFGMPQARTTIWLYRLPSLAGAVAAVLLTYWAGLAFLTRRGAALAAALFATTVLIGVEARLAKTDAVLVASVIACMGVLGRAYFAAEPGARGTLKPLPLPQRALFWTAMAVGLLVKGPITPMVVGLAALTLYAVERRAAWWRALAPASGIAWCLLLVAPWVALIFAKTGGSFFTEAVGNDMLGKVAAGQEAHGAPPGTYLALFWVTAWPMAPLAALAAPFAWTQRRDRRVLFLLAWTVPTWLLFELVPTKLPHYVLPAYPAIALMMALALEAGALHARATWRRAVLCLVPLLPVLGAIAAAGLWYLQGSGYGIVWFVVVAGVAGSLGLRARRAVIAGEAERGAAFAIACATFILFNVFAFVVTSRAVEFVTLSPRLAAARAEAAAASRCAELAPFTAGYREPSLVFLTDTNLGMGSGVEAAAFLRGGPCRIAFVEAKEQAAFAQSLGDPAGITPGPHVLGLNLNGGKRLDIGVYARGKDAP